jgi:hypothetical protein
MVEQALAPWTCQTDVGRRLGGIEVVVYVGLSNSAGFGLPRVKAASLMSTVTKHAEGR